MYRLSLRIEDILFNLIYKRMTELVFVCYFEKKTTLDTKLRYFAISFRYFVFGLMKISHFTKCL